ncbi:Zinc finger BED domain-containing protein [Ooceraea biroi]|uniref:Zinc finger BED domain-containing protein n=1 Tax=Ooceraea biroi TaxID=2015173 RepID=A0A026W418_OOCBI|nr:Zinc finger BED domain-containing protein [Ooceraea biroi]
MDKPGVPGPSGTRYTNPVSVGHKSKYWVHFRFLTDEKDEIKKDVVICNLCEMRLAYTRHINTLSNHLKHNHVKEMLLLENSAGSPNVYQELESNPPHERKAQKRSREASLNPTKHTTNVDGTGDGNLQLVADLALSMDDITIRRPLNLSDDSDNNTMNQLNIDGTPSDAVIEFIIMDLQLPESTEDHGFQRIVANLRPPCAIPSAKTLEEEIIPRIYETFRVSVKASLSCITSELALTFEEWISNNTGSYVTISAYYLKIEEAKLERKILTTILTQSDWKEKHWRNMIDILLREWDLNIEKVTAVVVSSSSTELIKALINHSLTVVPCLLHTLQVYGQACFDNPDVAQILTKCRSVIKTITSHQGIYAALQEQSSALKENAILVDDYPGVWISTYNMLEQMVLHRTLITSILENMEGMDQELNQEWIEITNDQWKIIDDLMSILKPLQDTIMTLNEEERIPQVSVLMPLLQRLVSSHLIVQESDSETAKSFKESLSDMLYKRYEDGNVTLFLQIATTLDPSMLLSRHVADKKRPGSPLLVLEVEDPKQCVLAHFMTSLESLDPVVESPVSRPLVLQRDTAAELVAEIAPSASQSILLANMEKNSDFPFITYYLINKQNMDPVDFYNEVQCVALRKFDPRDLRYAASHTLDPFNEVATIARPPLEPPGGRPPIPSTGYIVSIFKVFEGDDGLKFEQNWLYWTGARMMYRYLPKSVDLRHITLHKSMSQGDKMYLLICECSQLQDNLSAAAILLPALRARLCGYTGLYRPSVCF